MNGITSQLTAQLSQSWQEAKEVVVIIGNPANLVELASATAWAQAMEVSGKQVVLAAPKLPDSNLTQAIAQTAKLKLRTDLGFKDLQISFPYQPTQVDKVSYHIDDTEQMFHLVIKPQKGFPPLDPAQVEYSQIGASADLIFVFGVGDTNSLAHLYEGYETVFDHAMVVVFNEFEAVFGNHKVITTQVPQDVFRLAQALQLQIADTAATNLLLALHAQTNNFQHIKVSSADFELAAKLMQAGAVISPLSASQHKQSSSIVDDDAFAAALGEADGSSNQTSLFGQNEDQPDQPNIVLEPTQILPKG